MESNLNDSKGPYSIFWRSFDPYLPLRTLSVIAGDLKADLPVLDNHLPLWMLVTMTYRVRILGLMGIALLGLTLAVTLWDKAFPTASLDFGMSRGEITRQMSQWLETEGASLADYRHAVTFGENTDTKNYVELERGLSQLDTLSHRGLNVWYWSGRWFKPNQKEEFGIALDPAGHLVYYNHTVEETQAAPPLSKENARMLADQFLLTRVKHHPQDQLIFLEDSSAEKPNRIDYSFTWERKDLRIDEASYRLSVTIQGDHVGGYNEYQRIPENWRRDFAKKQSLNELCYTIANYARMPLLAASLILFVIYIYRRQIDWANAMPWGWFLLFALVAIGTTINSIPSIFASYETTSDWGGHLLEHGSSAMLQILNTLGMLWLLVVVVEPLYRNQLRQHLPLPLALGLNSLQYKETLHSIVRGVAFGCFSLGYVCLFYVAGKPLGVWSPAEFDYSAALSGALPWIEPLETGLSAAFNEELMFRALAILLYIRLFKSRWLAIILAAATWGFLHSNYPQMPGYIRGVELTIEGTLWGWLMLRYGILTPLVAHYLYDAWLGSMIVFKSPLWTDQLAAVIVSSWPIGLGIWSWWKYGRKGLLLETPQGTGASRLFSHGASLRWWEESSANWAINWPAFCTARRWTLIALAISGLVLLEFVPLPQEEFNDLGHIEASRDEIFTKADALLSARHQDPASLHKILTLEKQSLPVKYLLENGDIDQLRQLYGKEWPDLSWNIRYFQFEKKEEFQIILDKTGKLLSWTHDITAEEKGASLERAEALKIAEKELEAIHGVEIFKEKLVQDDTTHQEHRKDYNFGFERLDWRWGESKLRTTIQLQGDEAVNFFKFIKVPEAWLRQESATHWTESLVGQISSWLSTGKMVLHVFLFVLMIWKNILPWRVGAVLALFPTSMEIINWFNSLPWFFSGYSTEGPVSHYILENLGNFLMGSVWSYLMTMLSASVTLGLLRWAFDWQWSKSGLWPARGQRQHFWGNTLALALIGIFVWEARSTLEAYALGWFFPDRVAFFPVPNINEALPWLANTTAALTQGYGQVMQMALNISLAAVLYRRYPVAVWTFLIAIPILEALSQKTPNEMFYTALTGELTWLINLALIWRIWRFNGWAIFLAAALSSLAASMELMIFKGGSAYAWQALPLAILIAIPFLLAMPWSRRSNAVSNPA